MTLVHELTHALQDQHFDLTELDRGVDTSGEDFALTALIEGDATSIEDDYLDSLSDAEQDASFAEERDATVDTAPGATSDTPPVLDLFAGGPYLFGSRYVEVLRDAGGMKRVNREFLKPPTSEEQIIDAVAARAAQAPKRVRVPKLAGDEKRHGDVDDFGSLSMYLVLAARLDPKTALTASEGWGGDRYVAFTKRGSGGRECVRVAIRGDTDTDTREIGDAFEQWVAALPPGAATSEQVGDVVTVTACDTDGTVAPTEDVLDAAVTLLVDRNDVALEFLRAETRPRVARCAADELAADPEFVALLDTDELQDSGEARFSELVTDALVACDGR